MLPLACFIALSVVGQTLNVLISLAVEAHVAKATSILVFFALFLTVFWLAWKITEWIVDRHQRAIDGQRLVVILTTASQVPLLV